MVLTQADTEAVDAIVGLASQTGWTGLYRAYLGAKISGVEYVEIPKEKRRRPNEIYIRPQNGRGVDKVINTRVEGNYGDPVWIGTAPGMSYEEVMGFDFPQMKGDVTNRGGVNAHGDTHSMDGIKFGGSGGNLSPTDVVVVHENQFSMLSIRPIEGEMSFAITRGWFIVGNIPYFWADPEGIAVDGEQPSSGAALALVEMDSDYNVYVTAVTWNPYGQTDYAAVMPALTEGRQLIGLLNLVAGRVELTGYDIWSLALTPRVPAPVSVVVEGQAVVYVAGNIATGVFPMLMYNTFSEQRTITRVFLAIRTAPTTSDVIVDIHKNGTTIFSDQTHRPRIVAGSTAGETLTIDIPLWDADDLLEVHIDQTGTGTVGANLSVFIRYETS